MFYKVLKNSVSNYPNQTINCTVDVYKDEDTEAENAVYWVPFTIDLKECLKYNLTKEQIEKNIKNKGDELYNLESTQFDLQAIELGFTINAPEEVV